jgi:hypothetical protein
MILIAIMVVGIGSAHAQYFGSDYGAYSQYGGWGYGTHYSASYGAMNWMRNTGLGFATTFWHSYLPMYNYGWR